jgi:hypothetical protein
VKINKARILKIKPINPNISGRITIIDGQLDWDRNEVDDSFRYKPDAKPTYFKASCNDSNESIPVLFIFHLTLKKIRAFSFYSNNISKKDP